MIALLLAYLWSLKCCSIASFFITFIYSAIYENVVESYNVAEPFIITCSTLRKCQPSTYRRIQGELSELFTGYYDKVYYASLPYITLKFLH